MHYILRKLGSQGGICEESVDLMIPFYSWNRDSLLRICIAETFALISVHINTYSWEKLVLVCKSAKVRISKSFGGRPDLKILKKRGFPLVQSSRIYNCQIWVFLDFVESGNLFPNDLVAKHDVRVWWLCRDLLEWGFRVFLDWVGMFIFLDLWLCVFKS